MNEDERKNVSLRSVYERLSALIPLLTPRDCC